MSLPRWMALVRFGAYPLGAAGMLAPTSLEFVVLGSLFDILFVGVYVALDVTPHSFLRGVAFIVIGLGAFATPELVPQFLDAMRWPHVAVAVVATVVTILPAIKDRRDLPPLTMRQVHERVVVPHAAHLPTSTSSLAGWRLLARRVVLRSCTLALVSVLGGVAWSLTPTLWLADPRPAFTFSRVAFGSFASLLIATMALNTGVAKFLRHLKTLPLSKATLVLVTTISPALAPAITWMLLIVVFGVVTGPAPFRPSLLVLLSGFFSLADATGTRLPTLGRQVGLILPLVAALTAEALWDGPPPTPYWMPLTGAGCWAFAFWLNHETLTKASAASLNGAAFGSAGPQEARR